MGAAKLLLAKTRAPNNQQHAAFTALPRAQRERLTHALTQMMHQPNASATAVLEDLAQELKDRSLAQAGLPNLDKIEPQSVRASTLDAIATAALLIDVEQVIDLAKRVPSKRTT